MAQSSRLNFIQNEQELEKYQEQLGSILDYVDKLSAKGGPASGGKDLKTDGVETADGGTRNLENVWRNDEKPETRNQKLGKDLIKMAPETEDEQIKVKSVF